LSNRNAPNFFDAAKCVGAVTVVAGDNDSNQFAFPVFGERARKSLLAQHPEYLFKKDSGVAAATFVL
jgi:hypothetical protein